jgi:NADH dehydrogenase FAD-containing subunit
MRAPLSDVLKAIDVIFVKGLVDKIDTDTRAMEMVSANGSGGRKTLSYDRLVLATGSRLFRPPIPGLPEHAFSVDDLNEATKLDRHLKRSRRARGRAAAAHSVARRVTDFLGLAVELKATRRGRTGGAGQAEPWVRSLARLVMMRRWLAAATVAD